MKSKQSVGNKFMKRSQRGVTIVELSIVLAIIAVVIVSAVVGVQSVMRQIKVKDQLQQSSNVAAALQRATRTMASVTGVATAQLVNMGVWPENALTRPREGEGGVVTVRNVFGRPEFVNPLTGGLGSALPNSQYKYSILSVPREACPDLVSGLDSIGMQINVAPGSTGDPGTGAPQGTQVKAFAGTVNLVTVSTVCRENNFSDIHLVIDR